MLEALRWLLVPARVKARLVKDSIRLNSAETTIDALEMLLDRLNHGGEDATAIRRDGLALIAMHRNGVEG